jgi:cytochrome c biogenesis factor
MKMKHTLFGLTVTGVMVVASLTASAQQNKKVDNAKKEVKEAKKDLREARIDSAADYQKFKMQAEIAIDGNKKKIAELKVKKANDDKAANEAYQKRVLALEEKNNALKSKIEAGGATETSKWASFKLEVSNNINEVSNDITSLLESDKK